jgi:chromosomal replication initiation ATPase DnaA
MTSKNRIQPPLAKVFDLAVPIICTQFQVSRAELFSRKRSNSQAGTARTALYTLLYFYSSASLLEVANICDRNDHSTVQKSIKSTEAWLAHYAAALQGATAQLQAALQ